ncbi:glycosyltransferase family 1 protein [Marivita sp. XM-24bin2]|uniref:glycosyltransferase family 4 protein n=1 Tax=Marivita sp. XM-24bin2 TaxID=2133951 RepID=UPI0025C0B053|nr:glycosyltransferase family 1 protein [Marivita sp. XM-24bin2]
MTRTVRRAGLRPTGIDRIERAYIDHLIDDPAPLFGLVRTKLGFLLLDKAGCDRLRSHCDHPIWTKSDLVSWIARSTDAKRAATEAGLRKSALDRSVPLRLTNMLRRHIPEGTQYLNVGQTNFNDRAVNALKGCDDVRIGIYVHDTIPLDWPDWQTPRSRSAFRTFFDKVDRNADRVFCNSQATKSQILGHARHLVSENIQVLLPGLPIITPTDPPRGPWSGKPYFMAIGTIEPRKNIGFLLELWKDYDGPSDPHLILCGRRGWMNDEVFARLDQGMPNVHELSDLDDDAMWGLLQSSSGLLFPSLAEGFGYPAFEALHLNVPLICNALPVFRELLGDSAIYARESDCYAWRNEINKLAQKRQDTSGEQNRVMSLESLTWQTHFNQLFTAL